MCTNIHARKVQGLSEMFETVGSLKGNLRPFAGCLRGVSLCSVWELRLKFLALDCIAVS